MSSLFGQSTAQQQPTTATGLFGNTQPTTSLFGQQQQQQPNQSSNPFGHQQQQQQQQPASTSLFGGTNTNTAQPQTQQQPATTSLFGASQPATNAFAGFGAASNAQNQTQTQATSSLFGQNQSLLQQSTAPPANNTGAALFTRATKFNDLPEELRKKFEQIDTLIQGRVQISDELRQYKLGDAPQKGADQIRVVHKELVNTINKLRVDIASMRALRVQMDQAIQDAVAATRIVDAVRAPQAGGSQSVWLKNYAGFPLEFFTRVTEQLRERLQWFNTTLEQIERKLASEVGNTSVTPQSITATLQAQHASFVALAAKTAALDAELARLKETYRALWRAHTGSARDPFSAVDRGAMAAGEFGLEGLSVK